MALALLAARDWSADDNEAFEWAVDATVEQVWMGAEPFTQIDGGWRMTRRPKENADDGRGTRSRRSPQPRLRQRRVGQRHDPGRAMTEQSARSGASRFTLDPRAVELVAAANDRAQRLALRIGAAEKAIKRGEPDTAVLAILGGAHDA